MRKSKIAVALLALVCALATAPSAMAETPEFQAAGNDHFPASLKTTSLADHVFTFGKVPVTCEATSFSGTLGSSSPSLKVTPKFEKCTAEILIKTTVTVKTGTCNFELGGLSVVNEEEFEGTLSIVPAGCTLTFTPASLETCHVEVPAQKSLSQIKFDDLIASENAGTKKEVKVEKPEWVAEIKGMTATSKGCQGIVPESTKEATYKSKDEVENIVADETPTLNFIREGNFLRATFAGFGNSNHVWEFVGTGGTTTVTCVPGPSNENMSFSGSLYWRSPKVEVIPAYSGCTEGTNTSTIEPVHCQLRFTNTAHVTGLEYTGTGELINSGGNCILTITPKMGCTLKMEHQSPTTDKLTINVLNTGSPKQVQFKIEWAGISYVASGTCTGGLSGPMTNGKYTGTLKLNEIE
jgi:hypothetical protein